MANMYECDYRLKLQQINQNVESFIIELRNLEEKIFDSSNYCYLFWKLGQIYLQQKELAELREKILQHMESEVAKNHPQNLSKNDKK